MWGPSLLRIFFSRPLQGRTDMLWYKSWLETKWRFVIGLVLLLISAGSTVMIYPQLLKLLPMASQIDLGGELGRRVAESAQLSLEYRSYIWSQWFGKNMT